MKTFYVQRPHVAGTTRYVVGEPRKVDDENEVKHLVELGVLGEKPLTRSKQADKAAAEKAAAEQAAAEGNKAEGAAAANKAEGAAEKNK